MSLFQNNSLEVDNPQSREEDEELEEQRRRQEELADLLATGISEFNYDDSTMNSSFTSVEAAPPTRKSVIRKHDFKYDSGKTSMESTSGRLSNITEQNYKDVGQEEQLKILYDVRVREINKLREEFNEFKQEKLKEITILKNKATLAEAEAHHLQVTLSNSESLLVEKNQIIGSLKENVHAKEREIQDLKKLLEEQNLEICTYKSTVTELQLKLADNNPFNSAARKLNSGELQKIHQEQIVKLETLLQEQSKKCQILEKEKICLEEDLKKCLQHQKDVEEENNLTIMGLSKKLQNTQQQCKELFILGEAIKKESDHFKERMQQLETNNFNISGEGYLSNSQDKDAMAIHLEKLKRMLLDKDVELNTLKAKLKFYNSDLKELFEYRQMLSTMYSCDVKPCSNSEHSEIIIFLQRQLQSYEQAVEDRNTQIMNLNLVNKELQEKIEETIQQTRTDIQNISQKYSLPQLETMNNELKNAEETITELKHKLAEKNDLVEKIEKASQEIDGLQQLIVNEKMNFEKNLSQLQQELKEQNEEKNKLLKEVSEFKKTELQLIEENEKAKTQLQKICLKLGLSEADIFEYETDVHEVKSLKSKYGQIHDQLQHVLAHLENMNLKRTNFNIIFALKKGMQSYYNLLNEQKLEQRCFQEKLEQWDNMLSDFIESLRHSGDTKEAEKDHIDDLTNAKTMLEGEKFALEYQVTSRTNELEQAKKEIALLRDSNNNLKQDAEQNSRIIQKLNDQIQNLKKCLQIVEENKLELEKQLENTQKQLNEAKQETIDLHKEVNEAKEKSVKTNLFKELKDVENDLEKTTESIADADIFQKCLKAEVLKVEILLRDRFQEENIKKMQKIEDHYKNVITQKSEMYNKMKTKWALQEANYRKQFAEILEECGNKMQELENENAHLRQQAHGLFEEYKTFKKNAISVEKHKDLITIYRKAFQDLNNKWTKVLENYMIGSAKMEKQRHKTMKIVTQKINIGQREVNLLEHLYDEKIKKLKAEKGT